MSITKANGPISEAQTHQCGEKGVAGWRGERLHHVRVKTTTLRVFGYTGTGGYQAGGGDVAEFVAEDAVDQQREVHLPRRVQASGLSTSLIAEIRS